MKKINLTKWESFLIFTLTILFTINNFFDNVQNANKVSICIIIFLMVIGIAYNISYLVNIKQLIYYFFLLLILLTWKFNRFSVTMVSLGLVFMMISPEKIIYMYRWIVSLQILLGIILSISGIAPTRDDRTGVLSLGFVNENVLGEALAVLAITLIFEIKGKTFIISRKYYKWIILVFIILFNLIVINDNTAVVTIMLMLGLVSLKSIIIKSQPLKFIFGVSPLLISALAIWLGSNYNPMIPWMFKLNQIDTQRLFIWHYYFNNFPILWMPSKWVFNQNLYWGAFDGVYTYLIFNQGILFTLFIIFGLVLCNFRLINAKKWDILLIVVTLELASFSENIITTYYINFALIFVISAYNPMWIKNKAILTGKEKN